MSELFPVTFKEARAFVRENHRHNAVPQGHKFSIGLKSDGELIGVVICGRPIARAHDDGYTAEITRCCVLENQPNANSKLYAAALRAAKAMGYTKAITYTLPSESGVSLKAAGFKSDGMTAPSPNGWNVPGRPRAMPGKYPVGGKLRWVKEI
jgi:hypothetical protein